MMTAIDVSGTATTQRRTNRLLLGIFLILLGQIIYFASELIIPLILGLLLALTLRPVVRTLTRWHVPASIGALLVVLLAGSIIGLGGYTVSGPLAELMASAPQISDKIKSELASYKQPIEDIKQTSEELEKLTNSEDGSQPQRVVVQQPALINTAASTVASGFTTLAIALLLALFMLSTGDLFYRKLIASMPMLHDKKRVLRLVFDVERNVSRYLFTISLINLCLGGVIGVLLHFYGMPNAVLWGFIAMFLNFLPFLGALIGSVGAGIVALGHFDTLPQALVVVAIYYGCSALEGNLLTPLIIGRRLKLNIVAVFLTVTIWAWLWGLTGALVAVPILVVIKVLCEHVEGWQVLGHFLSGDTASLEESESSTGSKA